MNQILDTPSGAEVRASSQMDYVQNGVLHVNGEARSVLVTAAADLAGLTGYAPGSVAFTAGFKAMWQLAPDGTWVSIL